jgi:all-trans-retinol dehydrogenase (NAD+)
MSIEFASLGAKHVILLDMNADGLKTAASDVRRAAANGCEVHTFAGDLSTRDEATKVMARVLEDVGPVTILINNAGIVTGKNFLECDDRLMELTMRVNAEAHFWTTKAVSLLSHALVLRVVSMLTSGQPRQ